MLNRAWSLEESSAFRIRSRRGRTARRRTTRPSGECELICLSPRSRAGAPPPPSLFMRAHPALHRSFSRMAANCVLSTFGLGVLGPLTFGLGLGDSMVSFRLFSHLDRPRSVSQSLTVMLVFLLLLARHLLHERVDRAPPCVPRHLWTRTRTASGMSRLPFPCPFRPA